MTSIAGEERDTAEDRPDGPLPADDLFDVLSNGRRRTLVEVLSKRGKPMSVRDLSEVVARRELNCDEADLSYRDRKGVHVALYQTHLPKLAELEVVEHDTDAQEVRPKERLDELASYLEFTPRRRRSCSWTCVVRAALVGFLAVALLTVLVL